MRDIVWLDGYVPSLPTGNGNMRLPRSKTELRKALTSDTKYAVNACAGRGDENVLALPDGVVTFQWTTVLHHGELPERLTASFIKRGEQFLYRP